MKVLKKLFLIRRLEIKRQSVHAVAQTGWLGAVVKNVTQMSPAYFAQDFGTGHTPLLSLIHI